MTRVSDTIRKKPAVVKCIFVTLAKIQYTPVILLTRLETQQDEDVPLLCAGLWFIFQPARAVP